MTTYFLLGIAAILILTLVEMVESRRHKDFIIESVLILRYIDLRSRMFDTDRLMKEAPDAYAFMRDAYIQHRNYLVRGEEAVAAGTFYIDEDEPASPEQVLTNTPPEGKKNPEFPLTTN